MKLSGSHLILLLVTLTVTLLPMIVGLCTWSKLPDTLAIHFGLDGKPNGWAPRWVFVFLFPLLMLICQLVVYFAVGSAVSHGAVSAGIFTGLMLIVPACTLLCTVAIFIKALR